LELGSSNGLIPEINPEAPAWIAEKPEEPEPKMYQPTVQNFNFMKYKFRIFSRPKFY
jgi:hypothetical protein